VYQSPAKSIWKSVIIIQIWFDLKRFEIERSLACIVLGWTRIIGAYIYIIHLVIEELMFNKYIFYRIHTHRESHFWSSVKSTKIKDCIHYFPIDFEPTTKFCSLQKQSKNGKYNQILVDSTRTGIKSSLMYSTPTQRNRSWICSIQTKLGL